MENPLTEYGLFGWNYLHLLTHPWVIVEESYRHTKWFMQRGWRGYADCDVWGLDSYLASWLPEALEELRTNKIGHPIGMTRKGWNTRLERMKDGFLTVREYYDMNYTTAEEARILERRMNRGLNMFARHFLNLWD